MRFAAARAFRVQINDGDDKLFSHRCGRSITAGGGNRMPEEARRRSKELRHVEVFEHGPGVGQRDNSPAAKCARRGQIGRFLPPARCAERPADPSPCGPCWHPFAAGCRNASQDAAASPDRKSTRLNSSHRTISYAVLWLKKKK